MFRILQAHLSYQATNYSMKPIFILKAIKKLPTLNEKTKDMLDFLFWCRGRLQLSHALLRKRPRTHKGTLLPQKRCCNGIGVLGSSIWGMPLTKDAWRSYQLMLYDLEHPDSSAPFGRLLQPEVLRHILSFASLSVGNALVELR